MRRRASILKLCDTLSRRVDATSAVALTVVTHDLNHDGCHERLLYLVRHAVAAERGPTIPTTANGRSPAKASRGSSGSSKG